MFQITEVTRGRGAMTLADVIDLMTDIERKHVPFVTSRAINRTVFDVRRETQADMPGIFVLRRPWVRRGIRYRKADKRHLEGAVYTKDWFMEDQEEGDRRRPKGGKYLFRPTLAARRDGSIRSLPSRRPKTLMKQATKTRRARRKSGRRKRPTPFLAPMKNGKRGLFIRRGDGRKPITLLYVLERHIDIPPIWRFKSTGMRVSDKRLRRYFIEEMQGALASNRTAGRKDPLRSSFIDYFADFPDALESPVRHFGAPV